MRAPRPSFPCLRLAALALALAACTSGGETEAERGRRVYAANCTACHNANPALPGVLGPPIAGSSRALLEARVLRGDYPPGHEPKQDTNLMQPLPYLAGDLDALAAFLRDS